MSFILENNRYFKVIGVHPIGAERGALTTMLERAPHNALYYALSYKIRNVKLPIGS
jgi:hypothetical protein